MDAKPNRKLVPFYRLAAAAVLLLIVCIAVFYRTPEVNTIVHNTPSIAQPETAPVISSPATTTPEIITAPSDQPGTHQQPQSLVITKDNAITLQMPVVTPAQPQQQPEPHTLIQEPPVQIARVTPAPKPPMRVVHINEIDKPEEPVYTLANNNNGISHPHVVFKMKIVHLNDLLQPANEEEYKQDDKEILTGHFFSRRQFYTDYSQANQRPYQLRILQISQN